MSLKRDRLAVGLAHVPPHRYLGLWAWPVSLVLLVTGAVGCASGSKPEAPLHPSGQAVAAGPSLRADVLEVRYADAGLRAQMQALGLLDPFRAYWSAHAERRWVDRYRMEHELAGRVTESFYVAYHQPAWRIEHFVVVRVHPADSQGRVRVDVQARFVNPTDPNEKRESLVQDWWIPSEGTRWMHLNTDPMLNGMKPVV